ncbi:hypothetical protein [Luteimonas huabeiensis]|uniref:hypothetical protein n=1 Tax=Luteimonas huabeiensis TaxID=1244513 RepID=UPI0004674F54|nr:hypothetical protein [Luteimonas huabeiensis]
MHLNDVTWILVVLLIAVPVLIVAALRFAFRHRGGIGTGIGGAIFVTLCWATALAIILYRVGVFGR